MTIVMRPKRPIKQESISARSDNLAALNTTHNGQVLTQEQLIKKSESLHRPSQYLLDYEAPSPLVATQTKKASPGSLLADSNDHKSTEKRRKEQDKL
jgi:hypothetical protein